MSTLFFGGSSRSSGLNLRPAGSTTSAFERDLAMIEARRRRLRNMQLGKRQKDKDDGWFLDRFIPDKLEQGVNEIATSLIYTIPGIYQMASTVGTDLADMARGDFTPERSARMFRDMGTQMYQDIRHPLRHPGYTAMTAFGLASLGLGTGARVGAAAGIYAKANPASAAARALARMEGMPPTASGALLHAVPPSMRPSFGRPRGNQDPTVPEVQAEKGIEPDATQQSGWFDRWRANRQLKSLERWTRNPQYEPNLVVEAHRRNLRSKLGIPEDPHPADMAMAALPQMSPAERRAYFEQQRADPGVSRGPSSQLPTPDTSYLDQRLAARQAQVQQRRALEAEEARIRDANISQRALEIEMQLARPEAGWPTLPPLLEAGPRVTRVPSPEGTPEGQLSLFGGDLRPDPSLLSPPLSRQAGRDLTMGILRPPVPPKAPAKQARAPRAEPVAAAAAALPGEPQVGPIDYQQLAQAIAAQMRGEGPEGSYADTAPEEPRRPGRPAQEGDFSGPQKAEMVELAKSWEHIRTDDGGFDVTWAGLPAGRIERALDKDGAEVVYPSLTKEGAPENRRKYELTLVNPRRTRSGRPFQTKRTITAVTDAEAAQIARRLWSEWVVSGRTGGHPKPEGAPLKTSATRPGSFTGKKQGDTTKAAAEVAWAMTPGTEGAAELVDRIPAVGKSEVQILEDAQAEMNQQKADLQAELAALDAPDDELAAIEAEDVAVDPPKAAAKKKARNKEPLTGDDIAQLNKGLDPHLKAMGLRYNEKGYLEIEAGVDIDDILTELGFDPGDAFMIEDALEGAAGGVGPGGKFPMKEFQKRLAENFEGTDLDVAEVMNRLFGASGGAPGSAVASDMLRAFLAPRQRQTRTITARLPAKDDAGRPIFQEVSHEALVSNNPLVRGAWVTVYGALQALENPYAREGRGNFASRQLNRKIRFEQEEIKRINELAEKAKIPRAARDYEAALAEWENSGDWNSNPARVWDTVNRASMMGILFLKPAYLSANLIGQVGLAMIDHGWNPANIYASVKLQRQLFNDPKIAGVRAARIKAAMGEGAMESLSAGPGASKRVFQVHDFTSRQYAKLLDTPFRDNSFINEARRQGFTTVDDIARLVDAPDGSDLNKQFVDIARRANRNMIDYGRLSGIEKQLVRRILIFYPWLKGATIYGARFAAEHPFQFSAAQVIGREGAEQAERDLGQLPSFMQQQGVFKVGERNVPGLGVVPEIMNPAAISILGTPGETLNLARAALTGNVRQSEELAESLTPAATAALTAFTGTDPFTGAKVDPNKSYLERIGDSLFETLPFVRQKNQLDRAASIAAGETDPREILQPMNQQDVVGRWLGPVFGAAVGRPMGEFALNPREARQRAAAESRAMGPKSDAQMALHKDYRDRARMEAERVGVQLPPEFDRAMAQRGQREAEVAAWEAANGKKSTAYDRLEADMRLLVRRKEYTEKEAKEILSNFAALDEASINRFRRQLGDAFFGGDVRSYYKKLLNLAGADIDQSW